MCWLGWAVGLCLSQYCCVAVSCMFVTCSSAPELLPAIAIGVQISHHAAGSPPCRPHNSPAACVGAGSQQKNSPQPSQRYLRTRSKSVDSMDPSSSQHRPARDSYLLDFATAAAACSGQQMQMHQPPTLHSISGEPVPWSDLPADVLAVRCLLAHTHASHV